MNSAASTKPSTAEPTASPITSLKRGLSIKIREESSPAKKQKIEEVDLTCADEVIDIVGRTPPSTPVSTPKGEAKGDVQEDNKAKTAKADVLMAVAETIGSVMDSFKLVTSEASPEASPELQVNATAVAANTLTFLSAGANGSLGDLYADIMMEEKYEENQDPLSLAELVAILKRLPEFSRYVQTAVADREVV